MADDYEVIWDGRGPLTSGEGWQTRGSYLTSRAHNFGATDPDSTRKKPKAWQRQNVKAKQELIEQSTCVVCPKLGKACRRCASRIAQRQVQHRIEAA